MKERIKLFGWIGLFWICFFIVSRIAFLLYHTDQTSDLKAGEIATILLLGLRMDIAMTGYWLILTGLLFSLPFLNAKVIYHSQNVVTILLVIVSLAIVVPDLELYSHWGFRMNSTPLFYFSSEAVGSVNTYRLLLLIVIFIALLSVSIFIYLRFISKKILLLHPLPVAQAPMMLIITALLFIPIRSSFSVAPLNTGVVYFHSTKAFPNHAGINVVWNFFNSFSARDKLKYPTSFFTGDAPAILAQMETSKATPGALLNTQRPNLIIIILESFTAKIIEPLGGMKGITPNINAFIHDGILFDNFYASGDRTDRGLPAILSGYPAQPQTSIIRFPHKTQNLPSISRSLLRTGYHTSFVYGGDIGFANMESYLTTVGFSHITDDGEFDGALDNSKWGVADHFVFDRMKQQCDTAKSPFFKVMLSLSSHEPFEVPMKPVIEGNDERALFLNACIYTDSSLGNFINAAKKSSWWGNTLVIVTADHGHRFPDPTELKDKSRFKIPMLWLGGALAKRDTVVHTLGGQTDIAATLLSELGEGSSDFRFSKNLIDPHANPFAVYIFQNGFGYLDSESEAVYDFDYHRYITDTGSNGRHQYGEAYMQVLFNDYNER